MADNPPIAGPRAPPFNLTGSRISIIANSLMGNPTRTRRRSSASSDSKSSDDSKNGDLDSLDISDPDAPQNENKRIDKPSSGMTEEEIEKQFASLMLYEKEESSAIEDDGQETDTSDLVALLDEATDLSDLSDLSFLPPPPLQDPPAVPLPELPREESEGSFQAETQAPTLGSNGGGGGGPAIQLRIDTSRTKHDPGDLEIVGQAGENPNLAHLKKLVTEGQVEYAYKYQDTDDLNAELSEWFSYLPQELELLLNTKIAFEKRWKRYFSRLKVKPTRWRDTDEKRRRGFAIRSIESLESSDMKERIEALETLTYIVLGAFGDTNNSEDQLACIRENAVLLAECEVFEAVFQVLRGAMIRHWESYITSITAEEKAVNVVELRNSLTLMYFVLETLRRPDTRDKQSVERFREDILALEPSFLLYLTKQIGRLRWEEASELMPTNSNAELWHVGEKSGLLKQLLLLTWKTILLVFGSPSEDLPAVKAHARKKAGLSGEVSKDGITASPLDYHIFRQEIISKYPAYNPPEISSPFQVDSKSIIPSNTAKQPGPQQNGTTEPMAGLDRGAAGGIAGGFQASIIRQPVHINTPAPSPPPSPAPPGVKGGKKQNYQTNQNFPFIYPPEKFETTVSNKFAQHAWWKTDDSDQEEEGVPTSIKEAGRIFSDRIRITLALKQLWQEREEFLKHERGWAPKDPTPQAEEEPETMEDKRLAAVEEYYAKALPTLQSFVTVLLKQIVLAFTPPVPLPPQGSAAGGSPESVFQQQQAALQQAQQQSAVPPDPQADPLRFVEQLDRERRAEIQAKAITGILLLLLKWFRVSHVLKFEHLTQLIFDANYIPVLLKIFGNVIDTNVGPAPVLENKELTFFNFCNAYSANPETPFALDQQSPPLSPDSSLPPIIRRHKPRPSMESALPSFLQPNFQPSNTAEPGVRTEPSSPTAGGPPPYILTEFSPRLFFTYINYLRILQKLVKGKVHRNLLLVQFKASTILRKPLAKYPQSDLRLYTLKLFKGQVPYCGRKWRQSHMRFITAIYLHCRPNLRDDWLAGADVDGEVDDALPRERGIRAITSFYNERRYQRMGWQGKVPDEDEVLMDTEMDFFQRELAKMEGGLEGEGQEDDWAEMGQPQLQSQGGQSNGALAGMGMGLGGGGLDSWGG